MTTPDARAFRAVRAALWDLIGVPVLAGANDARARRFIEHLETQGFHVVAKETIRDEVEAEHALAQLALERDEPPQSPENSLP